MSAQPVSRAKAFRPIPTGVARAATEHMPFVGHRTCAALFGQQAHREGSGRRPLGKEMTDKERREDARNGSALLRRAILGAAK